MSTPAEDFAALFADTSTTTPAAEFPLPPGPRAPRPNHAQGTSDGAMPPPSPADMFAEMLTGVPYSDPNRVPGRGRLSAAETGAHAGWHKLHEGY